MERAEVPASRIYSVRDIVADPQYAARDMIREVTLDDGSTLKVPGVVPKFSETPADFAGGGPRLGEHTREVLRELGYDDAAIDALKASGVVATAD
jgi:formyl-CoA transferase